jgi:hypothetical protein
MYGDRAKAPVSDKSLQQASVFMQSYILANIRPLQIPGEMAADAERGGYPLYSF